MTNKFTWGDTVIVTLSAPSNFFPGQKGEICGFSELKTEQESEFQGYPIETVIYTVELGDGKSIQIPEHLLELV